MASRVRIDHRSLTVAAQPEETLPRFTGAEALNTGGADLLVRNRPPGRPLRDCVTTPVTHRRKLKVIQAVSAQPGLRQSRIEREKTPPRDCEDRSSLGGRVVSEQRHPGQSAVSKRRASASEIWKPARTPAADQEVRPTPLAEPRLQGAVHV